MSKYNADPVVEMRDIVKVYPGVSALDHVSLDVYPGELHGLVGKNGAGKSTLIKVLNSLCQPDAGAIRIRGKEHQELTTARAKSAGIAHVAQHANFVPGLSIAENLSLGDLPCRRGFVDWRSLYANAEEKFARFGLDVDLRKSMDATTVAERQMIKIARSLC